MLTLDAAHLRLDQQLHKRASIVSFRRDSALWPYTVSCLSRCYCCFRCLFFEVCHEGGRAPTLVILQGGIGTTTQEESDLRYKTCVLRCVFEGGP